MNDHPLNDPALRSFEQQLAGLAPQLPPVDQQELLYRCAFAAGQKATVRKVRRWQAATAALVVMLLGLSVPLIRDRMPVARHEAQPIRPNVVSVPVTPQLEILARVGGIAGVELDAWQLEPSPSAAFAQELARFKETDPALRSLAVGPMTATALRH